MDLIDIGRYAVLGLRARKLRSWLTVLGIVIGVASIISLLSLANGVNAQISSRLSSLGSNVLIVSQGVQRAGRAGGFPGFGAAGGGFGGGGGERANANQLSFDEAHQLSLVSGVDAVDARIQGRLTFALKGRNASVTVVGVSPEAFAKMGPVIIKGRSLSVNDRYTAVSGYNVYTNVFSGEDILNRQLSVTTPLSTQTSLRVVGLLNQSQGSFVVSDGSMYVPVDVAQFILNNSVPEQYIITSKPGYSVDDVAIAIGNRLQDLRHETNETRDFSITTAALIQSAVSSVTDTLALFLGGIAAISLVVGGIGVANTMFMSVLERTREIGVLKSLGMRDSELALLFLFESGVIGLIGGLLGVALSYLLSLAFGLVGVPSVISTDLVALGLLFSVIVGVVSGYVPARNAAKLQPVEALRYE